MSAKELLTPEQRNELLNISNITEHDLATHYTLTEYDIEIINQHRRDHNRLGFAIQLCTLRNPGCSVVDLPEVPESLIKYVALQLDIDPETYFLYARRDPTRREHLEELRQVFGYRNFDMHAYRTASQLLLKHAMENGNSMYLIQSTIGILREKKIILPVVSTIERLVWETRRAEKRVFSSLTQTLSNWQKSKLEKLTDPFVENKKTPLAWLREVPGQSSPEAFLKVIERLKYIRQLELSVNTANIHPNRLLQLARMGARYEPHSFRRFDDLKRHAKTKK
ncbi:TnpA family transposase [Paenibacillus brasilensis]|uniref:TnpA family transposase n=1 Tax=Paenibacillus brasilensis TaxID=128574 RepID=A0ABU0L0S6_9BACL|nr:TnpA family transposase [Paenibacillus brasilensis]